MRKLAAATRTILMLGVLILLLLAPAARGEPRTVIKLATLAPEGSSWMEIFKAAAEEAREKTGMAVQFRIYPGGVMGDERDMIRKMHINQIQAAVLTSAGLSNLFDDIDVLQVPFAFKTYQEVDCALAGMDAFFQKGLEENGYVLLGWSEAGFVHLMATVPVDTIAKLRQARVWVWNDSPMAKAIFEEVGVPGVPLSIPDVLVGLQTGLVEVVYAPPTGAIAMQWFTRLRYIVDVPLLYLAGGFVVNKDAFDRIPVEHRSRVREIFGRHFARLKEVIRKENLEAVEVMKRQGVQLVAPGADEVAAYRQLSEKAMEAPDSHRFSAAARQKLFGLIHACAEARR
jgi:TRAP-type C4-dicarboxylate transport system substrate-binding protein